jgi:hypothetical protein
VTITNARPARPVNAVDGAGASTRIHQPDRDVLSVRDQQVELAGSGPASRA